MANHQTPFDFLASEFVRYHGEFEAHYRATKYAGNESNEDCFITFGISGAGKSTTIARLLSPMDAKSFSAEIDRRDGEYAKYCTIEQVVIGHTPLATTVIPRVFSVGLAGGGKLNICDMPGFSDTNRDKRVIIDVLHKCFITRVRKAKYIVVVNIENLEELRLQSIMHHYNKPLGELLGEVEYPKCIEHLYFVLTKNTRTQFSSTTVLQKVKDVCFDIAEDNPTGAAFLKRLGKRHIIVDLAVDDRESLMTKLETMIDLDTKEQRAMVAISQWKVAHLEAGENELNHMAEEQVQRLIGEQVSMVNGNDLQARRLAEKAADLEKKTEGLGETHRTAVASRHSMSEREKELQASLASYAERNQALNQALDTTKAILQMHITQAKLFDEHLVQHPIITFRCDVAYKVTPGALSTTKPYYELNFYADLICDGSDDRVILIVDFEENDQTLRSLINRERPGTTASMAPPSPNEKAELSLIPSTLDKIKNLNENCILYNNQLMLNRCGAQPEPDKAGRVRMVVKHPTAFKLFVYSSRQFNKMAEFMKIKESFQEPQIADRMRIAELEKQIAAAAVRNEEEAALLDQVQNQLKIYDQQLSNSKAAIHAALEANERECANDRATVQRLLDAANGALSQGRVVAISSIDTIFQANNIRSALHPMLAQYKAGFPPIIKNLMDMLGKVSSVEIAERRKLTNLLSL